MNQARVIVTLVQIFEDAGQYLGFPVSQVSIRSRIWPCNILVRQVHLLRADVQELTLQYSSKVRRKAQDFLMSSEKTLFMTHNQSDYGAGESTMLRQCCSSS